MRLREAFSRATLLFTSAGIPEAAFEAELLLRHSMVISRAEFFSTPGREMAPWEEEVFFPLVSRRACREPSAYIVGKKEFYGLDILVDPRVLIPRPESELLVERALLFLREGPHRDEACQVVADIGTGSGALAIAIACSFDLVEVYASDISAGALEVARTNCELHGVARRVRLFHGDLLQPLPGPVDLLVANLPYIPDRELGALDEEIQRFEPGLALAGGADGLDVVSRLLRQAAAIRPQPSCLLLEVGQGQARKAAEMARETFPRAYVNTFPDLADIDRAIEIRPFS